MRKLSAFIWAAVFCFIETEPEIELVQQVEKRLEVACSVQKSPECAKKFVQCVQSKGIGYKVKAILEPCSFVAHVDLTSKKHQYHFICERPSDTLKHDVIVCIADQMHQQLGDRVMQVAHHAFEKATECAREVAPKMLLKLKN